MVLVATGNHEPGVGAPSSTVRTSVGAEVIAATSNTGGRDARQTTTLAATTSRLENSVQTSSVQFQSSTELYKYLFEQLDLKKDGRIDAEELATGLQSMGYSNLSKDQIELFLERSDVNNSGDLSLSEFVEYLVQHENNLRFMFTALDTNKDGRISGAEIKQAFNNMGINISEAEAENLVARVDINGSLDITFEEWRQYLIFHPSSDMGDIIQHWRGDAYIPDHGGGEGSAVPGGLLSIVLSKVLISAGFSADASEQLITGVWWKHLLAGGVAGTISRTCTAPLDRLKVMLQVHGGRKKLSLGEAWRYMCEEGGYKGLWRGNGVNVLKIAPESALKFYAYDEMKRFIKGSDNRDLSIGERFMAGSFAGAFSQTVIYPLEVIKTRLALRKTGQITGIADCVKKMAKAEGCRVFYRGYWPNLCGIIPYAGIDLAVYESLKNTFIRRNVKQGETPNPILFLACGTFSSCCGQLAAYPLALVRTKLQSQAGANLALPKEQTHAIGLFRYILRTEGFKGLYRGIIPNFIKVIPAVSISYYVYERARSKLGVEMS